MSDETTLMSALDQLAHAVAEAPDNRRTTAILATAVADLERAARASLGAAEHDPLVVLHRRFGRAHRLLVAEPGSLSLELVQAHLQALRRPPRTHAPCPTTTRPDLPGLTPDDRSSEPRRYLIASSTLWPVREGEPGRRGL